MSDPHGQPLPTRSRRNAEAGPAPAPRPRPASEPPLVVAPTPQPPPRPSRRQERWSLRLFFALAPRLRRIEPPAPPRRMRPWESVEIPRPGRDGHLAATWFPAPAATGAGPPRGAVLLLPPWLEWGRAYFHRRRRVEALRQAGHHVLTIDFPGFGGSSPRQGFFDLDVADALAELARRAPGLPLFVWGVSQGGYWSHMVLSGDGGRAATGGRGVEAAMFEDVSPHLIEWASRTAPRGKPFHLLFRTLFPATFRYFDLRRHAPALPLRRVAYVSGEDDPGVPPDETRELARRAGGEVMIVPGAGHLESIKRANRQVLDLALATFGAGG